MKIISCNVLAAALATALLSPAAIAQSGNSATTAQQVQEVPRAPLPPPVTPRLPVSEDPRTPPAGSGDVQLDEAPMTSTRPAPPPHAQSHTRAADQSAIALQNQWTTLDTDRDGRISADEAAANATIKSDFATIDIDDDGFISTDEHRAHVRQMAGRDDKPASQGAEQAAPHSAVVQRELWSELDTDGDGRISSVESSLDAQFGARFRSIDADGDGYVDSGEYRTYSQQEQMSFTGDADFDEEPMPEEGADEGPDVDPEAGSIDDEDEPVDDGRDGG